MEGLPRNNSDFGFAGTFCQKLHHDRLQSADGLHAADP